MAKGKKNVAVKEVAEVPAGAITVIERPELDFNEQNKGWSVVQENGKEVFRITDEYIAHFQTAAGKVGGILVSFEQRQEEITAYALNFRSSYETWKRITGSKSLPLYIHTYFDKTVPKSYGDAGSEQRRQCTTNFIFRGAEAMIKRANAVLKRENDRAFLMKAGVNPDDSKAIKEFNKNIRESDVIDNKETFADLMIRFADQGPTVENMTDLLKWADYEKEKGGLTKTGEELLNAAKDALLKHKKESK